MAPRMEVFLQELNHLGLNVQVLDAGFAVLDFGDPTLGRRQMRSFSRRRCRALMR